MDLFSNLAGFFGVALLAVPAFHVNRYALLIASLSSPRVRVQNERAQARRAKLMARLEKLRDSWQPWKAWCLVGGTVLAGLSYGLEIIAAVIGSSSPPVT